MNLLVFLGLKTGVDRSCQIWEKAVQRGAKKGIAVGDFGYFYREVATYDLERLTPQHLTSIWEGIRTHEARFTASNAIEKPEN